MKELWENIREDLWEYIREELTWDNIREGFTDGSCWWWPVLVGFALCCLLAVPTLIFLLFRLPQFYINLSTAQSYEELYSYGYDAYLIFLWLSGVLSFILIFVILDNYSYWWLTIDWKEKALWILTILFALLFLSSASISTVKYNQRISNLIDSELEYLASIAREYSERINAELSQYPWTEITSTGIIGNEPMVGDSLKILLVDQSTKKLWGRFYNIVPESQHPDSLADTDEIALITTNLLPSGVFNVSYHFGEEVSRVEVNKIQLTVTVIEPRQNTVICRESFTGGIIYPDSFAYLAKRATAYASNPSDGVLEWLGIGDIAE